MKVLLIGLCFQVLYVIVSAGRINNKPNRSNPNPYPQLDNPFVELLCPQGFKVSVPNVTGMQSFGFHGNLNSPIKNRGTFSGDVRRASPNGRWEFSELDVQLRNGEVINYWIDAEINGEQYRVENLRHIVKDHHACGPPSAYRLPSVSPLVEGAALAYNEEVPVTPPSPSICSNNNADLALIVNQLNTTLMQLSSLNAIVNPLRTQVESLTELLQEVIKDSDIGTKLLLQGYVPITNPVETVRDLITERLHLYDLNTKILQADYTDEGILFEMSSPIDKKRILFRASKYLTNKNHKIVDPQSYKYENEKKPKNS
ncbi:GNBPA2 family protein [Megaselia abdita]